MIVAGIVIGLYIGIWLMFIGGIAGLIDIVASASNGIDGMEVAKNVAKIVFSSFIGWGSALALIIPGYVLLQD